MGIPRRKRSPSRAHVDTAILRYALDRDEEVGLRELARRLFYRRRGQPRVCISLPVAGEFVETLARDKDGEGFKRVLDELWDFLAGDRLVLFGLGRTPTEAFEIAQHLQGEDPLLTPTDALIVACLLADEEAQNLYTTDPTMIDSRVIRMKCKARGKRVREL